MVLLLVATVFALGCQNTLTNAASDNLNASATSPAPVAAASATDDAPRIALADAKAAYDAGNAIFVDTRAEAAYKTEHIKGAVNITQDKLESKLGGLPKDKKIIAYCS